MTTEQPTVLPAMTARTVNIRYGSHTVLRDLDLTVASGTVYGLLGRNGAGKSTLVRCLLGQERPDSGAVSLLGLDSWSRRTELMRRVGVVPEAPQVPPSATADELLGMGARLYPTWEAETARTRLQRFAVPANVPFRRLSKGQQKQVELALALAQKPELLILDDPSLGLDSVARRVLYEELLDHLTDQGITVFLTSHDLDALERLVDTVSILHQGSLLVEEPLERLKGRLRRWSHPEGHSPPLGWQVIATRSGAWGHESVVSVRDDDGAASPAPIGEPMSLEEIFEALVGPHDPSVASSSPAPLRAIGGAA